MIDSRQKNLHREKKKFVIRWAVQQVNTNIILSPAGGCKHHSVTRYNLPQINRIVSIVNQKFRKSILSVSVAVFNVSLCLMPIVFEYIIASHHVKIGEITSETNVSINR